MNDATSLAHRHTARTLVQAFERAEQRVRGAFAEIVSAEDEINRLFALGDRMGEIKVSASGRRGWDNFRDIETAVTEMRRAAWRYIVEKLELRRMMSVKRWEELEKELQNGQPPPITEKSVTELAHGYASALETMFEEAVAEVYDHLRPRGDRYKTNSQLEIGERVILGYMVERGWTKGTYRVRYGRAEQQLTALENVFSALAGRGSVNKEHHSVLSRTLKEAPEGVGETEFFAFRGCKNGNLHIRFLRPDLLAKFNAIAGGKRLRPATSAA